jgi:hypothetical protein
MKTSLQPPDLERDGTIQRSGYCYELIWKLAQRILKDTDFEAETPRAAFCELRRLGWIDNVEAWLDFQKMRNSLLAMLFFIFSASIACAENILIIGDSLSCGPFGKHLVENLSHKGSQVTLYCAISSNPENWLKGKNPSGQICQTMTSSQATLSPCGGSGQTPSLALLLAKFKGSHVIVSLGTNSLLSPRADHSYRLMVQAIKDSGDECEWIGPPHLHASQSKGFPSGRVAIEESHLSSFYDSLANSVDGFCSLFDSRNSTVEGSPGHETVDGIHRNESSGKYWADHFTNSFTGSSARGASVQTVP